MRVREISARRPVYPADQHELEREARVEAPRRDLRKGLGVERHVDVGGEDGKQERDKAPASHDAGGRKQQPEATEHFERAAHVNERQRGW